eukprot:gene17748-19522_t
MKEEKEFSPLSRKKFYRRTAILTLLWCATILNAREEKLPISRHEIREPSSDAKKAPHRPFAPHINVLSGSEIQVSWLPVLMSTKQSVRYELFSGDDAEYVGYDLVYVAKRLVPGHEYKFRVRACSSAACSEFSLTRSCRTKQEVFKGKNTSLSKPVFCKRRIFIVLLPPLAIMTLLATLGICIVYFWRLICYYLWQYSSVPLEPSLQMKLPTSDKRMEKMLTNMEMGGEKLQLGISEKSYLQIHDKAEEHNNGESDVEKEPDAAIQNTASCADSQKAIQSVDSARHRSSTWEKRRNKKRPDERKRSASEGETTSNRQQTNTELTRNRLDDDVSRFDDPQHENSRIEQQSSPRLSRPRRRDAIIMIDNSNIFIGAREAACAVNPKLRPKHVKVRLQALVQVLEKDRNVTKRFACGSSPPANEQVWDIYRRLGYTVDLEDRRGKDEQRVDEQLHLCIYKAIIDLAPQTLVLASGDGCKGKSTGATSFPDCAIAALEHGWNVEVYSWKHSLSAEWLRIAAKHKENFKICFLDKNLQRITASPEYRCKSREKLDANNQKSNDSNRVRA